MKRKSFVGELFGRWTVLADAPDNKQGNRVVTCLCICGKQKDVYLGSLRSGISTSCGCKSAEMSSARRKTHGLSGTTTHNIWVSMKARCENEQNHAYANYGGRGITVCDSWMSFENFVADMGECPDGMSIDRENNDKGYSKANCRWATAKDQANNKRNNRVFAVEGADLTISQIAEKYKVDYWMLRARLVILGWSVSRAITEPSRQLKKH